MIISFSVFKEKIESGEKTQTIRRYSEFQFKRFTNAKIYHLYWHNPRNGGKLIKVVKPSEKPFLIAFNNSDYYSNIDIIGESKERVIDLNTFAKRDGFESSKEMFDWFFSEYGSRMYQEKFMVLRW
jgi:hypothetical protein